MAGLIRLDLALTITNDGGYSETCTIQRQVDQAGGAGGGNPGLVVVPTGGAGVIITPAGLTPADYGPVLFRNLNDPEVADFAISIGAEAAGTIVPLFRLEAGGLPAFGTLEPSVVFRARAIGGQVRLQVEVWPK